MTRPAGWAVLGMATGLSMAVAPVDVRAQAVCSAPHSSPSLAQSGSIETLSGGAGWIQLSAYGQNADELYNPNGDAQPFLAGSEFTTRSGFLTGALS